MAAKKKQTLNEHTEALLHDALDYLQALGMAKWEAMHWQACTNIIKANRQVVAENSRNPYLQKLSNDELYQAIFRDEAVAKTIN